MMGTIHPLPRLCQKQNPTDRSRWIVHTQPKIHRNLLTRGARRRGLRSPSGCVWTIHRLRSVGFCFLTQVRWVIRSCAVGR